MTIISSLLLISDTFVNVAHPLKQTEMSLVFLFLVLSPIYQTVKLLFADLKFQSFNIINHTPINIITFWYLLCLGIIA